MNIPRDTIWSPIEDTILYLDTFDILKLESVADDTIMYQDFDYPFFVDPLVVDNIWLNMAYKNNIEINDIRYSPTRKPIFYVLRSGSIVLAQKIRRYEKTVVDYGHGLQIWWYLKKAKELSATSDQLWNHPEVDTIINWDLYNQPDTTVIDTTL
jgi:hypothetical protein